MLKRMLTFILGAALVTSVAFVVPSMAGGNKFPSATETQNCGSNGDTVSLTGPNELWPPNHQWVDESVTAQSGNGQGPTMLTVTPSATDVAGGDGGPTHDPDWQPSGPNGFTDSESGGTATVPFQLRAERSGKGDGRTYTINWSASFNDGSCDSMSGGNTPFTVTVPHDMRGGASWK